MSNGDSVKKDTFEIYRDYIDSKFHEVDEKLDKQHDCIERVEKSLEKLVEKIETKKERKEEAKISLRHKLIIAGVTAVMAVGATLGTHFLSTLIGG